MPQRFLKPGILQSPRWNVLSWPAQSLFVRLITLVDDYARFDAHPLLLARVAFPYGVPGSGRNVTVEQIEEWLAELGKEMVDVYEVKGSRYLQIKRWTERVRSQNPSRFPPPPQLELALAHDGGCQHSPTDDSKCQQLLADDSKCQQMTANAALPSSSSASTATSASASSLGDKKKGAEANNGSAVAASRTQWAALSKQVKELSQREAELEPSDRENLRKKRRELRLLEAKQASGVFS